MTIFAGIKENYSASVRVAFSGVAMLIELALLYSMLRVY